MKRDPIYSISHFRIGQQGGPIPFLFNISGPLGSLQGALEWRLHDFCRIHQISYKEVAGIDHRLSLIDKEDMSPIGDIESWENTSKARLRAAVMDLDLENARIIAFVDQMTIVGLWAIAEQFLGKIFRGYLALLTRVNSDDVIAPYRWHDFVREFSELGINLLALEKYQDANECRVLNNAIKHDPVVGRSLLSFHSFQTLDGKALEHIPFEMQRYLNGVADFIGSLIHISNEKLTAQGITAEISNDYLTSIDSY